MSISAKEVYKQAEGRSGGFYPRPSMLIMAAQKNIRDQGLINMVGLFL